ncbi:putative zinc-containing alcohol dehydrogenase [Gordonia araii NBRC 100433]|uniref:Putative zinc-containing alcohol dehydrogenase n=1 Tax=Gordonia araii NBRC 100433 TaxID=1073574 RepID=G7GXL3_9ACTN|nr:zinc-dependent alcohol dehydrogenase family protein [Gordonia araii]NNG98223.1 zinc-dependent alcohol dehydrogenase family protein [Gordonia araii NBRC 100433]GAB08338.1 putative zinc-containing alcohol dehydrogenase [Gordonia araii NBRC 100433]
MRGTVLHAPGDVRSETLPVPQILQPTDAIIETSATCVCGSDLWPYRGINKFDKPWAIGHEYCGVVREVGADVTTVRPGQFVIGSFFASDNTCPHCLAGYQSGCEQVVPVTGCQAEAIRIPLADGTLVSTPDTPSDDMLPDLLALSDVMGTGWYAALAAGVHPGHTTVVVGDGAVGLSAVLAAKELGAGRIIAMSRHADRQAIAREFGATDIVEERGDEAVARVKELTNGVGADSIAECVGTNESMTTAIDSARQGGGVGFVGVPHGVRLSMGKLFSSHVRIQGGGAPVRDYLPDLISRVYDGSFHPGRVFDLRLPLADVAEGYRAMDERRAIKAFLTP